MGTGKSTVGKLLAKITDRSFLDTDKLIESREKMSINDIFSQYGEKYFRNLENNLMKEICLNQNTVIATGGGTLLIEDNYQLATRCGIIFLLQAKPEIILNRLKDEPDTRPLLSGVNKLEKISFLLEQREEKYNRFKLIIDTSNLTAEDVVSRIIELYKKEINNE